MKKLSNKKGFTLMEMIIVVAIIAILAVITIPTLTANTTKAEKAADAANLRSAKAAYQVQVMEEGDSVVKEGFYDVESGKFVPYADANKIPNSKADYCGQCSEHKTGDQAAYIKLVGGTVSWSYGDAACGN